MDKTTTIENLNTYHDDYLFYYDSWLTLADFREGAPAVKKVPWKYLTRRVAEEPDVYQARLNNLTFTPVASNAIRAFVTTIESAPLSLRYPKENDVDFWTRFVKNIDGHGATDRAWLVSTFSSLLYFGRVFSVVELPQSSMARSLYEQEASGLLPRVVNYEPLDVIDYSHNEWYKIRQLVTRSSPLKGKQRFLQYRIYDAEAVYTYEAEVRTQTVTPLSYRVVPEYCDINYDNITQINVNGQWVGFSKTSQISMKGEPIYHNLGQPPVIECALKPELWTGKDVYSKQHQYMKIESSYTEAGEYAGTIVRIFTPTPPAPLNDWRGGANEAQDFTELTPDNNHILIGQNYQLVESTGAALGNLEGQLNKIEAQIKAIVNLEHSTGDSASAERQSGTAKDYDRDLWESCVKTYGSTLKRHAQGVMVITGKLVSKPEPEVTGLNSFRINNANELLDQTVKLPVDLPSTARRLWYERLISVLLGNVSEEDEAAIREELSKKQEAQQSLDPTVQKVIDIPGIGASDVGQVLRGGASTVAGSTKKAKTS